MNKVILFAVVICVVLASGEAHKGHGKKKPKDVVVHEAEETRQKREIPLNDWNSDVSADTFENHPRFRRGGASFGFEHLAEFGKKAMGAFKDIIQKFMVS